MASRDGRVYLDSFRSCILDYVVNLHGKQANGRRSALLTLLSHACLISRGAKVVIDGRVQSISVLPKKWATSDPIRINYQINVPSGEFGSSLSSNSENDIQISATETDNQVFLNVTNTTTDKFGHLELSGPAHVRVEALTSSEIIEPYSVFSQLESTLYEMEENLWKTVLPKPPVLSTRMQQLREPPLCVPSGRSAVPAIGSGLVADPVLRDYGRSDLDPLGGSDWTRPLGGTGGMVLDPTQALRNRGPNPPLGALPRAPDLMAPPGARFDPIGPPIMPSRGIGPRGSRFNNPDPDSALPPGWEDMYM